MWRLAPNIQEVIRGKFMVPNSNNQSATIQAQISSKAMAASKTLLASHALNMNDQRPTKDMEVRNCPAGWQHPVCTP